ncbi:MAG: DUF1465 family protein [Pseudomonadota bacterium]
MAFELMNTAAIKPRVVDQLHQEAVALAEESRAYFARCSKSDRATLQPIDRVVYTAESLRISTRLMHVISWGLVRKAVENGEMSEREGLSPQRQIDDLDLCHGSDPRSLRKMPRSLIVLTHQSLKIYKRALRLQDELLGANESKEALEKPDNPVAAMLRDLETAM